MMPRSALLRWLLWGFSVNNLPFKFLYYLMHANFAIRNIYEGPIPEDSDPNIGMKVATVKRLYHQLNVLSLKEGGYVEKYMLLLARQLIKTHSDYCIHIIIGHTLKLLIMTLKFDRISLNF